MLCGCLRVIVWTELSWFLNECHFRFERISHWKRMRKKKNNIQQCGGKKERMSENTYLYVQYDWKKKEKKRRIKGKALTACGKSTPCESNGPSLFSEKKIKNKNRNNFSEVNIPRFSPEFSLLLLTSFIPFQEKKISKSARGRRVSWFCKVQVARRRLQFVSLSRREIHTMETRIEN